MRSMIVAWALVALAAGVARAQLPVPRFNSIFPSGARQGSTVECAVAGDPPAATGLDFSHKGITAEEAGAGKFRVRVAPEVPAGRYDVRAVTPAGVSSFRSFVVGDWPEAVEAEPNTKPGQAQRVTLPVVINGVVGGNVDIDQFVFAAKKGRRVIADCWAWRIDSQLDGTLAVLDPQGREIAYSGDVHGRDPMIDFTAPEDGDYTIKVWDFVYGGGSNDFYRLQVGSLPHLDSIQPGAVRPGETTTLTLVGRNLPGGQPAPGNLTTADGRPLEFVTREVTVPAGPTQGTSLHGGEAVRPAMAALDGIDYRLQTPDGSSNPLFLGFTTDPVIAENEPNDAIKMAQKLTVPSEVSGTFAPAGDKDFFAFAARKGEPVVIEVFGQRHSGLIDPVLTGYDPSGKRIQNGDDGGRNIGQLRFTTNTRDPAWEFNPPADGEYTVQVRDLYFQQRGEPRFTYRLSVRRPRPDFRLMAVATSETLPDATVVRQGGNTWLDVLAFRADGFSDPIRVEAADLPPGISCEPVVIGPGKTSVPLVFHAAKDAPIGHAAIRVVGKATIGEAEVVREARAGGIVWATVNTPAISRLADTIVLSVRDAGPFVLAAEPASAGVKPGETLAIRVRVDRAEDWSEDVQLSGFDLPNGSTMPLITVKKGAAEGKVELTVPANAKPGPYTFTINGSGQVPREYALQRDPTKPRGNNARAVGTSNPITITVGVGSVAKK